MEDALHDSVVVRVRQSHDQRRQVAPYIDGLVQFQRRKEVQVLELHAQHRDHQIHVKQLAQLADHARFDQRYHHVRKLNDIFILNHLQDICPRIFHNALVRLLQQIGHRNLPEVDHQVVLAAGIRLQLNNRVFNRYTQAHIAGLGDVVDYLRAVHLFELFKYVRILILGRKRALIQAPYLLRHLAARIHYQSALLLWQELMEILQRPQHLSEHEV